MLIQAHQIEAIQRHTDALQAAVPTAGEVDARDWAGFFKALAEFAATILPLILPLFVAKKPE